MFAQSPLLLHHHPSSPTSIKIERKSTYFVKKWQKYKWQADISDIWNFTFWRKKINIEASIDGSAYNTWEVFFDDRLPT